MFIGAGVQFKARKHVSKRKQTPTKDGIVIFQNPKDIHCGSCKGDFPRFLVSARYSGIIGCAGSHDPAAQHIEWKTGHFTRLIVFELFGKWSTIALPNTVYVASRIQDATSHLTYFLVVRRARILKPILYPV